MRIEGSAIPIHIARAYGVRTPAPAAATQKVRDATAAPAPSVARIGPSAITSTGVRSSGLQKLVAATVGRPVEFNGASTPMPSDRASLPLYTRAADRIEAATAINVGRTLDVRG